MRHKVSGRKLGRNSSHRKALLKNLSVALLKHGRITTTLAKAKELRTYIEPLINKSKTDTLHNKRLVFKKINNWDLVSKLFNEIGPKFKERNGGYTRVLRLNDRRSGDASKMAFIEIIESYQQDSDTDKKENKKVKETKTKVEETPAEAKIAVKEEDKAVEANKENTVEDAVKEEDKEEK